MNRIKTQKPIERSKSFKGLSCIQFKSDRIDLGSCALISIHKNKTFVPNEIEQLLLSRLNSFETIVISLWYSKNKSKNQLRETRLF